MYTLTYKRCDYIHTQTYVCIYKYLCVDIWTYICMIILNIGVASLSYANLGLFQRRVSEIRHFYFSVLTYTSHWIFFCLIRVATRNVDRTTKLPSLLLINIQRDRQKLTKKPSWRENKNHWQTRASCQMLCLLTLFPLMHEKDTWVIDLIKMKIVLWTEGKSWKEQVIYLIEKWKGITLEF